MTAKPIRWLVAALGLVMMPLMAGAQPAKIYLDPVSGDCSDLNSKWETGVNDLAGFHEKLWARTHYELVINEVSVREHIARNWVDLNQSLSIRRISSGARTCLQAAAFDVRFGARTQITRIHWAPLFPPCQPCATEWANHMAFIDSHERKHLSGIMAAVETANSRWPRGFPGARVIEVCGPARAITVDLRPELRKEIGTQLRETGTRLHSQIKEAATALDSRESLGPMNCSVCRCQVPAECKDVTVSPHVMRGGAPASGDVTLLSAAPPGGAGVLLKSDNPAASIPSQINVPEGAINRTFGMTLTPVQQIKRGFIYATRPGAGKICRAELWVYPPELVALETPSQMTGGTTGKGTVTLGTIAPAGGIQVQLSGDTYLSVPNAVVVSAGALEAKFDIDAKPRGRSGFSSQRIKASWDGTDITKFTTVY